MNRTMKPLLGIAAIVLVIGFVGTATAASLVINNGSFETPALDPGGSADITGSFSKGGWVQELGIGTPSAWRPDSGAFSGSPNALPSSADGSQCLSGITGEIAVVQLLSASNPVLGRLQANMIYTVTVAVGAPVTTPLGDPGGFNGVTVGWADNDAGTAFVSTAVDYFGEIGQPDTTGHFYDVTCSFNSNNAINIFNSGSYPGDSLALFIDLGGEGTVIDNIRATVSPAPEPSTLVLLAMAIGTLGLLAYAWRKRK